MGFQIKVIFGVAVCLFGVAQCLSIIEAKPKNCPFELSIIHFSDFHARFVPIAPNGGLCYDYLKETCVGGIARVATITRQLKQTRPNAILLNAGDSFQGTLYYDLHHGNITSYFMNQLPHDASTIGNHDFDDSISGLVSYVKSLHSPVVVANIDHSNEPSMQNLYTNSTLIHKGNRTIGIIGVVYDDMDKISSNTGKLKFLNEVDSVNLESKKLKSLGVNIIIVLSHCGIEHDKIIASSCPDVDVVVGGHSHILLYNGNPPSNDIVYGSYPLIITQKNTNRKVLVAHASAYTKYMGDLKVIFDENGEVVNWKGNPIYLDRHVKEDSQVLEELQPWTADVNKVAKEKIGETRVFLNGSCASGKCNLANFITDVMVEKYSHNASISLFPVLTIQNSIPKGVIVYEDIYATLPYNNTWDLIDLQGKDLLQVLEENVAVSVSNTSFANPKFVLWSGLEVHYNMSKKHSKVLSVKVRCFDCTDKKFENLDLSTWYRIVIPEFLISDYFKTIRSKYRNYVKGKTHDLSNVIEYIKKIKVIDVKDDSRIVFV